MRGGAGGGQVGQDGGRDGGGPWSVEDPGHGGGGAVGHGRHGAGADMEATWSGPQVVSKGPGAGCCSSQRDRGATHDRHRQPPSSSPLQDEQLEIFFLMHRSMRQDASAARSPRSSGSTSTTGTARRWPAGSPPSRPGSSTTTRSRTTSSGRCSPSTPTDFAEAARDPRGGPPPPRRGDGPRWRAPSPTDARRSGPVADSPGPSSRLEVVSATTSTGRRRSPSRRCSRASRPPVRRADRARRRSGTGSPPWPGSCPWLLDHATEEEAAAGLATLPAPVRWLNSLRLEPPLPPARGPRPDRPRPRRSRRPGRSASARAAGGAARRCWCCSCSSRRLRRLRQRRRRSERHHHRAGRARRPRSRPRTSRSPPPTTRSSRPRSASRPVGSASPSTTGATSPTRSSSVWSSRAPPPTRSTGPSTTTGPARPRSSCAGRPG